MPLSKLKNLFVSETCLRFCAIDSQISFLALAIVSKKIQNHQWNSRKVVAIWRSQWKALVQIFLDKNVDRFEGN